MIVIGAAALLALLVPRVLMDLVARPTIRRLGLRNALRRPSEAALVIGGSMLATALIVASLLIGDSFGASVRSQVSTVYGPIDQIVPIQADRERGERSGPATSIADASQTLSQANDGTFDGLLPVAYGGFSAGGVGSNATLVKSLQLVELDPGDAKLFGDDIASTGLAELPSSLGMAEVAINARTADALRVGVGDQIQLFLDTGSPTFTVASVLERRGLAGFGDVLVNPGAVTSQIINFDAVTAAVLVSNQGDDEAGAELTDEAVSFIGTVLGEEVSVFTVKQNLLDQADFESTEMTELFGTIGGFSVVAGVLLLVNLFMMLAAERRRELGTMQAIGLDRQQLSRAFALEGFVYGLAAAVGGALLGIGVAAAVLQFADRLLGTDGDVTLSLSVSLGSLLAGAGAGLAISQLTVVLTSARITKLNVVSAMKGLEDPPTRQSGRRAVQFGAILVVAGLIGLILLRDVDLVLLLGPVGIILGAVPFLAQFMQQRKVAMVAALLCFAFTGGAFALWGDRLDSPELSFFLVQGILFVGLGTLLVASMDGVWARLLAFARSVPTAVRLGLAHPLDRPARTGLLIAMYALVIFTVTFMAILNTVFQQQVPQFAEQIGGEFDVLVDSNPTRPFTSDELEATASVERAVPVLQGDLEYTYIDDDGDQIADFWWASTVADSFPSEFGPKTTQRSDAFETDAAVWEALAAGDNWIVVPSYAGFSPDDVLTLEQRDGSTMNVAVAAITELNYAADAGFYVPPTLAPWLVDGVNVVSRHYLLAAEGVSTNELINDLNGEIERGATATSFITLAQADVDEQQAFIRLLQGYLALGLLIGLAGLGVVLARAVRERRQQLGVLGAIGLDSLVLRNVFIVEAAFVGAQGVLLGISLGIASSWLVVTRSNSFATGLGFAVPALGLVALAAIAFVAAVAAGAIPARQAGRVSPAMALRTT